MQLIKNGKDANILREIIADFEKESENELILQDFYGKELIFFNLLCSERGYTYKRLNYDNVLITKT